MSLNPDVVHLESQANLWLKQTRQQLTGPRPFARPTVTARPLKNHLSLHSRLSGLHRCISFRLPLPNGSVAAQWLQQVYFCATVLPYPFEYCCAVPSYCTTSFRLMLHHIHLQPCCLIEVYSIAAQRLQIEGTAAGVPRRVLLVIDENDSRWS